MRVGRINKLYTIFFVKPSRRMQQMWRPRATPHVGTCNDLQVAHDISFGVVTKIQYFWGNRPARGLSLVILRGKIGTFWLLRIFDSLCSVSWTTASFHYIRLSKFLDCWSRKSWRTTSNSNNTINHDWRRHLGRCTTPRRSGAYPGTETTIFPAGYARLSIRHPKFMDCTGDIVIPGLA